MKAGWKGRSLAARTHRTRRRASRCWASRVTSPRASRISLRQLDVEPLSAGRQANRRVRRCADLHEAETFKSCPRGMADGWLVEAGLQVAQGRELLATETLRRSALRVAVGWFMPATLETSRMMPPAQSSGGLKRPATGAGGRVCWMGGGGCRRARGGYQQWFPGGQPGGPAQTSCCVLWGQGRRQCGGSGRLTTTVIAMRDRWRSTP